MAKFTVQIRSSSAVQDSSRINLANHRGSVFTLPLDDDQYAALTDALTSIEAGTDTSAFEAVVSVLSAMSAAQRSAIVAYMGLIAAETDTSTVETAINALT